MVTKEYSIAFSEVLEILKYIDKPDFEKIPKDLIQLFKTNSNKQYNFCYDTNKSLDEQNVSYLAKCIIAILYKDYWANDLERSIITNQEKYLDQKKEELKKQKYDVNNIFKNKNSNNKVEETALVVQKNTILSKIFKKIKSFFR